MLLLLVHWLGCIWYLLINTDDQAWIPPKDLDKQETTFFLIDQGEQYTVSFYQATLLIVGNESAPITPIQMLMSSIVIIIGSIFTAFIFGNMAALMASLNKKDVVFQGQIDMANSTMRAIKMPSDDQDKVIKYMQYIHETPDVEQDSDRFFDMLSSTLRREVLFKIHKATLDKIEILQDCSQIEKSFIVGHLLTQLFMEGDEIIR